jgi:hypothetical protein
MGEEYGIDMDFDVYVRYFCFKDITLNICFILYI